MQRARFNQAFGVGLALACTVAGARADEPENALKLGYAHIGFNTQSGDLAGPAGTTPPGIEADLKDASALAVVYERHVWGGLSVVLQAGTPPVVKMYGAGNGAALGEVGTARAWFPALVAHYTFDGPFGTLPYVGAGVNHTSYSHAEISAAYTGAFGGTASTADLKSSWGSVLSLGIGFPLGKNWIVDAAYCRYGIKTTATITTATTGVGDIARTIDVKADPDVVAVTVGYRF